MDLSVSDNEGSEAVRAFQANRAPSDAWRRETSARRHGCTIEIESAHSATAQSTARRFRVAARITPALARTTSTRAVFEELALYERRRAWDQTLVGANYLAEGTEGGAADVVSYRTKAAAGGLIGSREVGASIDLVLLSF